MIEKKSDKKTSYLQKSPGDYACQVQSPGDFLY